jgi:hypothetical protein
LARILACTPGYIGCTSLMIAVPNYFGLLFW